MAMVTTWPIMNKTGLSKFAARAVAGRAARHLASRAALAL